MSESAIKSVGIKKLNGYITSEMNDFIAVEEPLEIRLILQEENRQIKKSLSVTMRTPGSDPELAVGFLFTEGIIRQRNDVRSINAKDNVAEVELDADVRPELQKTERNFYTTSSCGVCGKSSLDAIKIINSEKNDGDLFQVSSSLIFSLPDLLKEVQGAFRKTGGLHASALFDSNGKIMLVREDVGRHNALDKLIGNVFLENNLPLTNHLLLLSGRASFELIQKAAMAGIRFVAAVGSPSSLAVELAKEFEMTLIGFLRDKSFNIYNGHERIVPEMSLQRF